MKAMLLFKQYMLVGGMPQAVLAYLEGEHDFNENEISDEQLYRQIMRDKLSINQGMLYENVIAQMLVANGHKLYFYPQYNEVKHRNDIEIDFIISNNSKLKYKLYPIEVKSNEKYTTSSLDRFYEKYRDRIGECYVIHPKGLEVRSGVILMPPYMTMCLGT